LLEAFEMVVGDVMTAPVVTIDPESAIGEAVQMMQEGDFRRLPVVDASGRLLGIVTDRDLRQATNSPLVLRERWYSDFLLEAVKVKACMTPNPITVGPATPVLEAVRLMRRHKIGGLPVVEDGRVVGILTTTDVLDFLIRTLEKEQTTAV
jgi:CBS domain-containing protein